MSGSDEERYSKARAERKQHVDAVLQSKSRKKIVVAGPGTGKTFLFKEILKDKKNSLTLTFINSLVEDLSLDLCGLSEVRTLHGFARSVIGKAVGSARVFPKLSKVIEEDAEILDGKKIDFDSLFHNRDDKNEFIPFYKLRKTYYGHYGFADVIYAAVLYLEQNPEKIPIFDQILVDEFQDFNLSEVSLIDLLASKNPILIAGDDDQSLYFFKNASPAHIRERYSAENGEYESFNLPHCSRCTSVIVAAANDVVVAAKAEGHLKDRIDKPYLFFEDEKKESDCKRYPTLAHVTCYSSQSAFFIAKASREIAEERKEKFSILIIAPTKSKCRRIARSLQDKGFKNIQYVDQDRVEEPTLFDAMVLLAENSKCNLGWRIAANAFLSDEDFKFLLERTKKENPKSVCDLIDGETKKLIKSILSTFKKVAKQESISHADSSKLSVELDLEPQRLAQDALRSKIAIAGFTYSDPATRNIPIKITTIPSSKGLAEDYVFIADFDDRFFLEKDGKCSDQKIFDFLVAITRARRKVFLISSQTKTPKFLTWIAKERVETVTL